LCPTACLTSPALPLAKPNWSGIIIRVGASSCRRAAGGARPGYAELVFVAMMCAYASDIARGPLQGPYDAADARRYARAACLPLERACGGWIVDTSRPPRRVCDSAVVDRKR